MVLKFNIFGVCKGCVKYQPRCRPICADGWVQIKTPIWCDKYETEFMRVERAFTTAAKLLKEDFPGNENLKNFLKEMRAEEERILSEEA